MDSLPATDTDRKKTIILSSDSSLSPGLNPDTLPDSAQSAAGFIPVRHEAGNNKRLSPTDVRKAGEVKLFTGKETIFYTVIAFIIAFALMRIIFSKYFSDLARIFFRRTIKQRQVYELLIQTPLPSILLNVYFVLTGGLYLSFLLDHQEIKITDNFWIQFFYCSAGLAAIYLVKFGGLKVTGWIFNIKNVSNDYIFIVFMINKAIGIFLLPCIILIAFSSFETTGIIFYFSWIGITILLLYRLVLSFGIVRNQVKVNIFHFIIYVIAFEVIPLMLIYKWLLQLF